MAETAAVKAGTKGKTAVRREREAKRDAEAERSLGRAIGFGIPGIGVVAALGLGLTTGAGPAILSLASAALLGTIALFWASLRTLGGDAPLAEGLEEAAAEGVPDAGTLAARKRTLLRALKDLENEREIGKIEEADYAELAAKYRAEAKAVMRAMDAETAPEVARAEAIVKAHLAKRGLADDDGAEVEKVAKVANEVTPKADDLACGSCGTKNDPDAVFCKKCGAKRAVEASS